MSYSTTLTPPLGTDAARTSVGISRRVEPYTERTTSPVSDALSDDMRRRGMKFVGSTTVYAVHQAASYIDAHGPECNLGKRRMS